MPAVILRRRVRRQVEGGEDRAEKQPRTKVARQQIRVLALPAEAGCSGEYDVDGIMAHEVGHVIGLGHSNVAGATMYPSVSACNTGNRSLAADDIAAAQGVIRSQEQAFGRDDPAAAYSHAAPAIQDIFPDAETFMAMVRNSYAPVYRHKSFEFGEARTADGKIAVHSDLGHIATWHCNDMVVDAAGVAAAVVVVVVVVDLAVAVVARRPHE